MQHSQELSNFSSKLANSSLSLGTLTSEGTYDRRMDCPEKRPNRKQQQRDATARVTDTARLSNAARLAAGRASRILTNAAMLRTPTITTDSKVRVVTTAVVYVSSDFTSLDAVKIVLHAAAIAVRLPRTHYSSPANADSSEHVPKFLDANCNDMLT